MYQSVIKKDIKLEKKMHAFYTVLLPFLVNLESLCEYGPIFTGDLAWIGQPTQSMLNKNLFR